MLNDDRVAVPVWMTPELRDQLLADGGSKPVHPMRLIPDAEGFQLVVVSVRGVLTENAPVGVGVVRANDKETT